MRTCSTNRMWPGGTITLLWLVGAIVDVTFANDCVLLMAGNDLTVPENTECTVPASIASGNLIVRGTMKITSTDHVLIEADTITVEGGGIISADDLVDDGVGRGNSLGSGGW